VQSADPQAATAVGVADRVARACAATARRLLCSARDEGGAMNRTVTMLSVITLLVAGCGSSSNNNTGGNGGTGGTGGG
jgi:hypothetical protein